MGVSITSLEYPRLVFWPHAITFIAFVIVAAMTFPMNVLTALALNLFLGDLLAGYAIQPDQIFLLNALALSAVVLNSWLWAFICLRNSATPVREAPAPPRPED